MNLETEIKNRDLWAAVQQSYDSQLWSNAIINAIHFLSDGIRTRTGLESDGAALAGQALGGKTPKLKLSRLETDSEKNVQAGVEQLLRGLYQAIRNPRSHERFEDPREDAEALILFVDFLLRLLGQAKDAFSIDECVSRILEDIFVPEKRYVELLIAEIPPRQRLQVALGVFRRKSELKGTTQRAFFKSLLDILPESDQAALFEAISAELRVSRDDSDLRATLQLLTPDDWPRLSEVSRLRTENRLLRDLGKGSYSRDQQRCRAGAVATWSSDFWKHFSLRQAVVSTLIGKLRSSEQEEREYVLEFCWHHMLTLFDSPPISLQRAVADRLRLGDKRVYATIGLTLIIDEEEWGPAVSEAIKAYREQEPALDADDDVPF